MTEFPKIALLAIAGLVLPAILIPVVKITGYSEVIEETAKALIVLSLILKLPTRKSQILAGIGFGFLFGFSESFFYLNNIFQFGDFSVFWQRILWTVPMHIITVLLMISVSMIKRWLLVFGLAGSAILHILFNSIA